MKNDMMVNSMKVYFSINQFFFLKIDLCLPAVFMPFRSGNVFNPRAYRFFHHVG